MRFEVAVLAAAATLFAPIQAQTGDVRVAALAYTGIFAEDDPICYGDLITTVNVYEHRDGTCHAATGAECITTVALDPGAICWLKSFGDSACTESLQEEHLGNDYLVYDHVPARNSFQIWCYPGGQPTTSSAAANMATATSSAAANTATDAASA